MGYWGTRTIDNDESMDWIETLRSRTKKDVVYSTLEHFLKLPEPSIDPAASSWDRPKEAFEFRKSCSHALAAAEAAAAFLGAPCSDVPAEFKKISWGRITAEDKEMLKLLASKAVQKAFESEAMSTMLAGYTDHEVWKDGVCNLLQRLAGVSAAAGQS